MRLDIAAGTAVRFEPGQTRDVTLVPYRGARQVFGFNQKIMGGFQLRPPTSAMEARPPKNFRRRRARAISSSW